jgi:hypothetical protein
LLNVRNSGLLGVVGPLLMVVGLTTVTLAQKSFLADELWSPVRRNGVEWPSILLLSPDGEWVAGLLVVFAVTGVCFTLPFVRSSHRLQKIGGVLWASASVGIALEAVRPDRVGAVSWEGEVHNDVFPLITLAALACLACFAAAQDDPVDGSRGCRTVARASLPIAVAGIVLTNVDPVAQLGRYVLFASLLTWQVVAALSLVRWRGGDL